MDHPFQFDCKLYDFTCQIKLFKNNPKSSK
nr:MAG TPA: protein of unknown function (DUF4508) [Caudoviricetes sp.]